MTEKFVEIRSLKNETLIEQAAKLAKQERVVTAELERRKAYRELGFGSLWSYLRESLGMSEAGAGHGEEDPGGEEGATLLRVGG